MSDQEYQITPLGAAFVEALPDRKKARMIERQFKEDRICPSSALFSASDVVAFYKARGEKIAAYSGGVKSRHK